MAYKGIEQGGSVRWWTRFAASVRRRPVRIAVVAAAGLATVGALVPKEMTQATFGAVVSPLSVLNGRGPGGRTGDLTTTKPPKAMMASAPLLPAPGARPAPASPAAAPQPPSALLAQVPNYAPGPVAPIGGAAPGDTLVSQVIDPGPVPSGLTPPQASIDPNNPNVPNPPPGGDGAVPEMSTWAMMILGLFGTGAALRRARREGGLAGELAHA